MQPKDIVVGARYANHLINSGIVYIGIKWGRGKRLKIIYPKHWITLAGERLPKFVKHPSELKSCSPRFWDNFYRMDTVEIDLNSN